MTAAVTGEMEQQYPVGLFPSPIFAREVYFLPVEGDPGKVPAPVT